MLKKLSFLTCLGLLLSSTTFADILVENSASQSFGGATTVVNQADYTLTGFDAGSNNKLVVGFGVEAGVVADFSVSFGGIPLAQIITANDLSEVESTAIYFLDGATGVGDIVVTTGGPTSGPLGEEQFGNGPGIYAVALSGAEAGVETSGRLGHNQAIVGDLTGTLTGISDGAYVMSVFTDQSRSGDQTVTGDLEQVSVFSGLPFPGTDFTGDLIGSAVSIAASGFGDGSDLSVTFNDLGENFNNPFNNRANAAYASFAVAAVPEPGSVLLLSGLCGLVAARRRRR